jgi:tetratricopeptide (TPR) repeat protein
MAFDNYKEEEQNEVTKKIHELIKQDAYEKILRLYKKIPDKEKTPEQARCTVSALILLKRIDDARALLDTYADAGKEDAQWHTQYGWTYYIEQKYKEAIPYFDKVEDLTPKNTTMLNYLRECNENAGNKEEAKRLKMRIREINTLKDTGDKYKKENYYKNKK